MNFLWTTCQIGFESWLKAEVAAKHKGLRFSYSRPGFLTFKSEQPLTPDFHFNSGFARAFGVSLERTADPSTVDQRLEELKTQHSATVIDRIRVGANLVGPEFDSIGTRNDGAVVLTVVILELGVKGQEFWFGVHKHSAKRHRPWAGGIADIVLPADAPSRAYLKLEEGVRWAQLPMQKGDLAIELGSSPGGASFALLERGLFTWGVDPGEMQAGVLRHRCFHHFKKQAGQLTAGDLDWSQLGDKNQPTPKRAWAISDMNISPVQAADAVLKMCKLSSVPVAGGLVTIKLTADATLDSIHSIATKFQRAGFANVRFAQLYTNRAEVCLAFESG